MQRSKRTGRSPTTFTSALVYPVPSSADRALSSAAPARSFCGASRSSLALFRLVFSSSRLTRRGWSRRDGEHVLISPPCHRFDFRLRITTTTTTTERNGTGNDAKQNDGSESHGAGLERYVDRQRGTHRGRHGGRFSRCAGVGSHTRGRPTLRFHPSSSADPTERKRTCEGT